MYYTEKLKLLRKACMVLESTAFTTTTDNKYQFFLVLCQVNLIFDNCQIICVRQQLTFIHLCL